MKRKQKKKTVVKKEIVGVYYIGFEQVQLVLREGGGGEFFSCPEIGSIPRVKIGTDGTWEHIVSVLLHELMEFAMFRANVRFAPDNLLTPISMASFIFCMTHEQFADCAAKAGECLAAILPDLAREWKFWKK